jgi:hypothetical protein
MASATLRISELSTIWLLESLQAELFKSRTARSEHSHLPHFLGPRLFAYCLGVMPTPVGRVEVCAARNDPRNHSWLATVERAAQRRFALDVARLDVRACGEEKLSAGDVVASRGDVQRRSVSRSGMGIRIRAVLEEKLGQAVHTKKDGLWSDWRDMEDHHNHWSFIQPEFNAAGFLTFNCEKSAIVR